jgi:hypothetical protein
MQARAVGGPMGKKHVFVLEDEPATRMLLEEKLERARKPPEQKQ